MQSALTRRDPKDLEPRYSGKDFVERSVGALNKDPLLAEIAAPVSRSLGPISKTDTTPPLGATSSKHIFRKGDRVKFTSPTVVANAIRDFVCRFIRSPPYGSCGKVLLTFDENPGKVGVRFDESILDGNNLGGICEDDHGFFCNANELCLEDVYDEDMEKLRSDILFEVVAMESKKGPFILFIKDVEKAIVGNCESHTEFKSKLEKLDGGIVVIGSQTCDNESTEKAQPGGVIITKFGPAVLDFGFRDPHGRLYERSKEVSKAPKMLSNLFPNKVSVQAPQDEGLLLEWKRQLDRDIESLKSKANLVQLRSV